MSVRHTNIPFGHGSRPKKSVEHQLWVRDELLPQMVEFKYLWVLFLFEGHMWIGVASLYQSAVVKIGLSVKRRLLIYRSICTSICG